MIVPLGNNMPCNIVVVITNCMYIVSYWYYINTHYQWPAVIIKENAMGITSYSQYFCGYSKVMA